ncbi:MAG: replication initiation protein [Verrucomicrobia bacterium]|nr:replication initiation protein [Verrucomicrobiota bacterium]
MEEDPQAGAYSFHLDLIERELGAALANFNRSRSQDKRKQTAAEMITSYTRWIEAVQAKGENSDVYLAFSPRFKRLWLKSKKHLLEYVAENPAPIGLRRQYALRLYDWAKKYVTIGQKRISMEQLRKVLRLEPVKAADGKIVPEPPVSIRPNFRQRALDNAIAEINKKTDLRIELQSIERAKHRRVTGLVFLVKTQSMPDGDNSNL